MTKITVKAKVTFKTSVKIRPDANVHRRTRKRPPFLVLTINAALRTTIYSAR